ncbi:MAG TPA: hypothetical protein VLA33_11475 [Gemmatimonadota bacterium]|nr:hypothetical protein [Gemmatimonadota bacterium]
MTRTLRTSFPRIAAGTLLALVLLGFPGQAAAQSSRAGAAGASPYLPLDHWAYPALELWIARGDVTSLSPMTRPYRIADVVGAVDGLRREDLSGAEQGLRARLLAELGPDPDEGRDRKRRTRRSRSARHQGQGNARSSGEALVLEVGLEAGARYVTQTHPDPLQPVLDGRFGNDRVLEGLEASVRGSSPYVAGAASLRHDGIYRHDPRFPDGRVTPPRDGPFLDENLSLRLEEAYVEAQIPYLRLSIGRLDRDWGPATIDGFVRSAQTYSQDEIGYRFGIERIFLIGTIGAPGDFGGDTVRHLSMHRLEVRPSDRLAFAISEAALHGGPDGRFRFELANPVGIWQLALDDEDVAYNKVGQLDAWWRAARGVTLNGSLLADATGGGQSCCQMGGSLGVELTRLAPGLRVGAQFSAVESLTYRTFRPWEEYSIDGVGLGWDKSDLRLVSLEADWFASPSLVLSPRLDFQRRGEGDFRQPRPPPSELTDQPDILSGIVETTVRPALGGRWTPAGRLRITAEWDAGVSLISDYANVEGDDRTELTGSFAIRLFAPRLVFLVR